MIKIMLWIAAAVIALSIIPQTVLSQDALDEDAAHVIELVWVAEENQLLIATANATIQRLDLNTDEILNTYQFHTSDDFTMALQSRGHLVASADGTGDIHLWNMLTSQTILIIPAPDLIPDPEFFVIRPIRDVAWNPDQTEFATVRADDNTLAVHDAVSGDVLRTISVGVFPDAIFDIDWHHGNGLMAVSSSDNVILDPNSMKVLVTLEDVPNTGSIIEITWSPDGSRVAGGSTYGHILVWDAESGEILYTLQANEDGISSLSWHPLGDHLASGYSKGFLAIWEMKSGNLIEVIETSNKWINVAFSRYGGRLAFGGFLSDNEVAAFSTPNVTIATNIPAFEVIVPNFLQGEILQAIGEGCLEPSLDETLNTLLTDNQLDTFVAQIEALPDGAIPPACRADLLAVASALGNDGAGDSRLPRP